MTSHAGINASKNQICHLALTVSTIVTVLCAAWLMNNTMCSMRALPTIATQLNESEMSLADVYSLAVKDAVKYAVALSASFLLMITMLLLNLIYMITRTGTRKALAASLEGSATDLGL